MKQVYIILLFITSGILLLKLLFSNSVSPKNLYGAGSILIILKLCFPAMMTGGVKKVKTDLACFL